jgi:hypothetical protein
VLSFTFSMERTQATAQAMIAETLIKFRTLQFYRGCGGVANETCA